MKNTNELKDLTPLERHIKDFISSPRGFENRFLENQRFYLTKEQAYEATERQYSFVMGQPKYKSYDSFRNCMNRRTRTKRRK